jgi:hypothetical protein
MAEAQAQQPPWAWAEFADVRLGDARLRQRLVELASTFADNPEESIPGAYGGDWSATKAAYRFFDNDQVEFGAILDGHRHATLRRIAGRDFILIAQDTSTLDFTKHHATKGLGRTGAPGLAGFFLHSGLAMTAEGLPLGLLAMHPYVRENPPADGDRRKAARAIKVKESVRWLDMLRETSTQLPPGVTALTVADREADIFEFFALAAELGQPLLVRAQHDRNVIADEQIAHLWQAADAGEVLGVVSAPIPREHDRPERIAHLALQLAVVALRPPQQFRKHPPITVRAIYAREMDPPEDQEAIHWLLLTTLPVVDAEQATQCLIWYTYRWRIERFHHVLKSGCGYEKLQLETAERLWRALAVYAVVAWRVLYVDLAARAYPQEPCTTFLTEDEWKALCCHRSKRRDPPAKPPDAYTAVRWIAKLGGFLGRKGDGEPGVKTLWRGMRRLQDITEMWCIMRR